MKRKVLINLICSVIATVVVIVGVILGMILTGKLDIEKKKLIISSASTAAIYNGETLSNPTWYLTEGALKEGHTLSVSVSGAQKNVGISENHLSAKVFDSQGADVSSDYNIEYRPGVLNVKARDLCIIADSAGKLYDGEPLECDSYYLASEVALLPTDTLSVTVEGSITEKGKAPNKITSASITNDLGIDVSKNYNITTKDGVLLVYDENTLVIKSFGATKEFDGLPLTNDNWAIINGHLRTDHWLSVDVTGSQLLVGQSDNTFEATVYDEQGNDVTDSYDIASMLGVLIVNPPEEFAVITSDSDYKPYDGTPLTNSSFEVSPKKYESMGLRFEPVITGSQTEIGVSENTIESCRVYTSFGVEVTEYFQFETVNGKLEVGEADRPANKLVIRTDDASKKFDGTPLTNKNWELVEGELKEGHYLDISVDGSRTDIGCEDNTLKIVVRDSNGKDVTDEYTSIKKVPGTLTVEKIDITVTAGSAQKKYNGIALECEEFTVAPFDLEEKYIFECETYGSRTNPGVGVNTIISCSIYEKDEDGEKGEEVTQNFNITKESGELIVLPGDADMLIELTYTAYSDSKVYDGTPLTGSDYMRAGELLEGHREVVTFETSITKVGTEINSFTVTIYDEGGNDVTDQYLITSRFGSLTVTPKKITVTASNASKPYDGYVLSKDEYSLKNTATNDNSPVLAEGDSIEVSIVGSIKEIGTIDNVVASVHITNANGEDVTDCYEINRKNGTLQITDKNNNGEDGEDGEGEIDKPTGEVYFKVASNVTDKIYLKSKSYGNYDVANKKWNDATVYDESILMPAGNVSAYYLPYLALNGMGYEKEASVTIEWVKKSKATYMLPYYTHVQQGVNQFSDIEMMGNAAQAYTATYYDWDGYDGYKIINQAYSEYEQVYRSYVYSNYCYVDDETRAFMNEIIAAKGFSGAVNGDLIQRVARYIQDSAEYNMDYDRALNKEENPTIAFLQDYQEGVCRHYAQAATLLYRSMGIPARYTEGFVVDTEANETVEVTDEKAHAWVEVYIDGIGWLNVEVTGGMVELEELNLEVTPSKTQKRYTGSAHKASNSIVLEGDVDLFYQYGYTYEVVVSGERTEPGISNTTVSDFIIRNSKGNIIYQKSTGTGKDTFHITYNEGKLHVYLSEVVFSSSDASKVYDGTELKLDSSSVTYISGLDNGEHWEATMTGSIVNVGSKDNSFNIKIIDSSGQVVTDNYVINTTDNVGELTITPRSITITAASKTKKISALNGEALTCNEIKDDYQSQLASGDYIYSFVVEGSQSSLGSSDNIIKSIVIYNAKGQDVTGNYQITTVPGKLTVK